MGVSQKSTIKLSYGRVYVKNSENGKKKAALIKGGRKKFITLWQNPFFLQRHQQRSLFLEVQQAQLCP